MVTNTTSLFSEYSQAMCFVYHDGRIVFMFQTYDFGQVCQVAFHREHTVHYNQLHWIRITLLKLFFQIRHIIVFVFQLLWEGEATAIYDRGVVAVVTDDIIVTVGQSRNNTWVYCKTGRKTESFVLSDKSGQLFLQLNMQVKCTVQKAWPCATGTIFVHSFDTGFNHSFISRKASVCIGTEHQHFVSAHFYLCTLFSFNLTEIWVNALCHKLLWQVVLS